MSNQRKSNANKLSFEPSRPTDSSEPTNGVNHNTNEHLPLDTSSLSSKSNEKSSFNDNQDSETKFNSNEDSLAKLIHSLEEEAKSRIFILSKVRTFMHLSFLMR